MSKKMKAGYGSMMSMLGREPSLDASPLDPQMKSRPPLCPWALPLP